MDVTEKSANDLILNVESTVEYRITELVQTFQYLMLVEFLLYLKLY